MKVLLTRVSFILSVIIYGTLVGGCGPEEKEPIEYKLAVLDAGGYVPRDDLKIVRYRTLLDLLCSKVNDCSGNEALGAMVFAAKEKLASFGLSESMLNMMEVMNRLTDTGHTQALSEYLAAYIAVRSDLGESPDEATLTLRKWGAKLIHDLGTGRIRPDGKGGIIVQTDAGPIVLRP